MHVAAFTFNPFSENTYIIYDESKECMIIDPGCFNQQEQDVLLNFIESKGLIPKILFNTHCHIDHVLGNHFVAKKYALKLTAHAGEKQELSFAEFSASSYGIPYHASPAIELTVEEGHQFTLGNLSLDVYHTPGHSSNSLCLIHHESKQVIAGDVLFYGSIGRTDLPGGDFDTLINSIKTKLLCLDDDYIVYPGHGEKTTIGFERANNPFLQGV